MSTKPLKKACPSLRTTMIERIGGFDDTEPTPLVPPVSPAEKVDDKPEEPDPETPTRQEPEGDSYEPAVENPYPNYDKDGKIKP